MSTWSRASRIPLPFRVICELLGVPEADRPPLHDWFRVLLRPWGDSPPPEAVRASDGIVGYLAELVAAKRQSPGDDLVSVLVDASADDRLSDQEVLSSLFQLIVAGHDTTTAHIGNSVVALLDHPDQLDALLGRPRSDARGRRRAPALLTPPSRTPRSA